ncbi:MAG: hypothetical protein K0U40_07225 [Betaproteobacteria bacterium]|nr:hypothetical protein [Betaproteobacteria bacterium]
MKKKYSACSFLLAGIIGLFFANISSAIAEAVSVSAQKTISVGVPAQEGSVDGKSIMSDEFIWQTLTKFAAPAIPGKHSPVVFETWASDADTFNVKPVWPAPDAPKNLQASVLQTQKLHGSGPIDVPCTPPPGAATGNFPMSGCIAEETKRNKPQFDYIVQNGLNTQAGLAKAHAENFNVQMPTTALSVKGDWVPVKDMLEWLPELGTVGNLRKQYYTNTSNGVEYAVVSIHVSSRQNPNWVWGSFENEMNPGRCDYMGCWDKFGAVQPEVKPNLRNMNGGYGKCEKTDALKKMLSDAGLDAVWSNYCLKASMVDYTAADGTPYILGNSVIEGIVGNGTVAASSCIACHVYASYNAKGKVSSAASGMLPFNPTGKPLDQPLIGSAKFDFMWGVIKAP